ncbi:MAG: hypothetical protein ACYDBQ_03505 [Thermoplasmatota archaeon]
MQKSLLKRDAYVNGTQSRIPIPRQHFLHRLTLHAVLGNLVGGAGPAFIADAADLMVQNLQLVIGGQLTKDNLSMADLRRLNILQYKQTLPDAGYAYLDLGRLPTHAFTSLELVVQYAPVQSITTGNPTDMTGAYLEIKRLEELNVGQPVKGIPLVLRKTQVVQANAVTNVRQDIRSGNVLQAVLIIPSSSTLIQAIDVVQDGVKYHLAGETWGDLREENKADFELDVLQADFGVVNFDKFGNGTQALRTAEMNTLEFVFTTNSEANGTIRLVPIEIATAQ